MFSSIAIVLNKVFPAFLTGGMQSVYYRFIHLEYHMNGWWPPGVSQCVALSISSNGGKGILAWFHHRIAILILSAM